MCPMCVQAVRFYGVLLPGYLAAVLIMLLRGYLVMAGKGRGKLAWHDTPIYFKNLAHAHSNVLN